MNKLSEILDAKLVPIMSKVSNQRHLSAIRDGLVATIPLTIIGAIFLLIATFPFPKAYVDFMANNPSLTNALMIPFTLTIGLLSIYVSFCIGYQLAKTYHISPLIGGIAATLCFLTTIGVTSIEDGSYINKAYLGGEGMFSAIITSVFNEPILFGVPFILNPTFFIPLLLGPLVNVFITYFAFTTGIVAGMGNPLAAAWNFPSFLAGFLCTNSWTGVALVIVNFLVYFAIYYPFFKIYEKKSLQDEGRIENETVSA